MVLSLCDTSVALRLFECQSKLKAEGSARLPARTTRVHLLFFLMSKTARSFLPAFTQRERDSLRHTEGIRQTHDRSTRAAGYHQTPSSTSPCAEQGRRTGSLSALRTAQGCCVVASKHFLDCEDWRWELEVPEALAWKPFPRAKGMAWGHLGCSGSTGQCTTICSQATYPEMNSGKVPNPAASNKGKCFCYYASFSLGLIIYVSYQEFFVY